MGVYSYPVLAGLSIATQPSNQTVIAGSTATFAVTVTASGSQPITYQWKKNGVNIAGATQSSYTTPATTALDDDASFSVEVKNASGTLPSNTAKLGVTSPPAVLTQPTAQTVTQGQTASFSVTASGSPLLRYQWKKNGADIADANSSSYTTPATLLSDNGAIYSVQISNERWQRKQQRSLINRYCRSSSPGNYCAARQPIRGSRANRHFLGNCNRHFAELPMEKEWH